MTRYIYSAEEAVQLLNETEKARASLALEAKDLRDQISDLNAENIELKKCLAEIEEREAACCPEDVAFDEQIVELRKLVEQMRGAIMTECEHVCEGRLRTAECDDDCKTGCHLYAVITAAERGNK